MHTHFDDRLAALHSNQEATQFEGNAFSDGILGMWWGAIGAGGVVLTIASIVGGLGQVQRGTATLGSVAGWAVASSMIVVFVGILVGATCGFASAAVAHYARGVAARAVSGIVSANVIVVAYVALLAEGDLSVLLADDVFKLFAATCLVATGAGLMAAINVGREVGS